MIRNKKKLICFVAFLFVAIALLSASIYTTLSPTAPKQASADAVVGDRITPLDLMSVHQVDFIMGPLAKKNASGQYVDDDEKVLKDEEGYDTNNVYGIPAKQYFNIESYIYTEYDTTNGTRVLRGFKKGITYVYRANATTSIANPIDQATGLSNGALSVYHDGNNLSSANKYMLIIPDDITSIGTGSGAFFCNAGCVTGDAVCPGHHNGGRKLSDSNGEYQFTDFANFIFNAPFPNGYFSPRERIAGIYFNSTSKLTSIDGGVQTQNLKDDGSTWTRHNTPGKNAIAALDNMRFCVLPNNGTLTRIGDYAFMNCNQLRDFNLPSSVTSLGKGAFNDCSSLIHLSVPSSVVALTSNANAALNSTDVFTGMTKLIDVENNSPMFKESDFAASGTSALFNYYSTVVGSSNFGSSHLYVIGNSSTDTGATGYYFCKNVRGSSATLATTSTTYKYQKNQWYAIALAGKEDTSGDLVHIFPDTVSPDSERRQNILYDYLSCDGQKCKNTLSETIESYDIGNSFAKSTWCTAAVLPHCVDIIGDNAFNDTHLQYLELHATKIGNQAFYGNSDVRKLQDQYYYIHNQITGWGTNPFAIAGSTKPTFYRNYIFENKTVYDTYVQSNGTLKSGSVFTSIFDTKQYYQIPVYLNVESENGDVNIGSYSDLSDRFIYDDDYATRKTSPDSADGNGTYRLLFTKRLNGKGFNVTKQANGSWAAVASFAEPNIAGNLSTVWYRTSDYQTKIESVLSDEYVNQQLLTAGTTQVNIYTKNIGAPNLTAQTYQYDKDVSASKTLTFNDALKITEDATLSNKYTTAENADFIPFTGTSSQENVVQNAGTYTIPILLNSEKWGVWDSEVRSYSAEVTVKRAEFDLGNLDNLPRFSVEGGTDLGGTGEGTTIYQYPDGWYQYPTDKTASDSKVVLNSFVRHTGSPITIAGRPSDDSMYKVIRSGGYTQTDSDSYLGSFSLEMRNGNYVFSTASYDKNKTEFQKYGIIFTDESEMTDNIPRLHITKRWYIVIQTNWLIDEDALPGTITPYALLTYNGNTTSTLPYEATFKVGAESETDKYVVHIPKLARGTANLTFTMAYGATMIVPDNNPASVNDLRNYVNSAMPAGTYTVTISAPGVTIPDTEADPDGTLGKMLELPAIRDIIRLTVTPKPISAQSVLNLLGTEQEKTFEHAEVKNQVNLYDDTTKGNLKTIIDTLNVGVNTARANAAADNIWTKADYDSYYEDVTISYNLDRMRTTTYYNDLATFADRSSVPQDVGKYLVYYSLSAKNYQSVGGVGADDRRDYCFNTVIYRELSLTSIANTIRATGTTPYPYVYNGGVINANVPYSAFYTYAFSGDRTNATKSDSTDKPTVTLTISDPDLTRWESTSADGITTKENGKVADITYTIQQATNYWSSQPQVPGWSYDGFIPEVHTFIGTLAYSPKTTTVYYRIGTAEVVDSAIQYYEPIDVGGTLKIDDVTEPTYFTVNTNGVLQDDAENTIQKILNALDVLPSGQFYYLEYYVFDTEDGNVKGTTGKSDFRIYLTKTQNYWETTPALTPYQYTQFRQDFIAGIPHYSTAASVVYKIGETVLATVYDAEAKEYKLSAAAIEELNKLTVGSYRIDVTLAGDTNYNAMATYQIPFSVMQAQANTWKTIPGISSWTYGRYTESLLTIGEADYGTVFYSVQGLDPDGNLIRDNEGNITSVKNFANLSYNQMKANLANLNAGSYNLFITSKGTTDEEAKNYVAATRDMRFTVSKAQNEWDPAPSIEGWTYRETAQTPTLGVAKYEYDANNVSREYYTAHYANGSWAPLKKMDSMENANAGDYVYVTTVDETTNYLKLEQIIHFQIARAENDWATDCEPEGTFTWTWGKTADVLKDDSGFAKAAAVQMTDDKEVTYTISGASSLQTVTKKTEGTTTVLTVGEETFNGTLVDYMKQLSVGNYQVTTSVKETANYAGVSKVTYVTVNPASFEWQIEPAGNSWTWGVADSQKTFTEPVIKAIAAGDTAKFTYVVNKKGNPATTTYDTVIEGKTPYALLLGDLKDNDAATYEVTVSVSCDNYTTLTKTVEVEIKQATNVWTANAPATSLARAYEIQSFVMPTPVPKYGKVTYTYGGNTTEDISVVNTWINDRDQSQTPYIITVSVPETVNYTGLSVTTELTVTGAVHEWDNKAELVASYSFQFSTSLIDNLKSIKLPAHACTDTDGGTLSYTVRYTNLKNETTVTDPALTSADAVKTYLAANAHAGTYVITASYTHNNDNITTVPYQITVNVTRATAAWDSEIATEYINPYEAVEMETPSAGASVVTVTVKDGEGSVIHTLPVGGDLKAYLNTLNVGSYTVTSLVEETNDFTGLAKVDTRVVITPATNTWQNPEVLQSLWTFKRNQENIAVGLPVPQRGTVQYFLDGMGVVPDEGKTLNDYLKANAATKLTAGDHTLRFYVAAGEHGNYNGLTYDCTIRISKNDNNWAIGKAPEETYDWFGTVNVNDFKIPVALNYSDLLHFDIEKVVGPATVGSSYKMNEGEFKEELAKLVNGTYRVTMRVGGECGNPRHEDYTTLKARLVAYNNDYNELLGTTVITIAPKANVWNDQLVADSTVDWTYGATDNPTVNFDPENAEKMEIRINNEKITISEGSTLDDYVKTHYNAETLLIKATVPANDVYTALEKVITLKIAKSGANGWVPDPDTGLKNLKLNSSWVWDNATRDTQGMDSIGLVAPVPIHGDSVEVTVRAKNGGAELFTVTLNYRNVDGVKTVNDNSLLNRLAALDVGEYVATAVIPESDNYLAYPKEQDPVAFKITQAENDWRSKPEIGGWSFNGETAYPTSTPKYGNKNDVVYSYAPIAESDENASNADCLAHVTAVADSAWKSALPLNAGRYYIRGILTGTTNYETLVGHNVFTIGAGTNEWVDMPGVIAWNWNNYNREVNQFSASARNGGEITFSIMKADNDSGSDYSYVLPSDFYVYNGTQLTLDQVKAVYSFGFVNGKLISETVANVLNALLPGTYYVRAEAGYANNFGEKVGYAQFQVGEANNEWVTAPNVLSYGYGALVETGDRKSLTAGEAKYGTANIYYQVNDGSGKVEIKTQSTAELTAKLKTLKAGNYVLRSWVPAGDVYGALYSETSPYTVLFGVTRTTQNSWAEGHLPKTPLSEFYTVLHKDTFDFATWFGNPKTADLDASIVYTLLNTDLTSAKAGEYTYGNLFAAIKDLNSGDYVVRLTATSDNYLDLSADISLTIKRSPNDFSLSNSLSGQWRKDGDDYLTTVDDLSFTATYSANATFTLNNKTYTSFATLKQALQSKEFNAGTYQITVSVDPTNEYEGFTGTVRLDIAQDDNSWKNQWTIENSLGVSSTFNTSNGISWTYGTNIVWDGARPKYGTLVYVDIRRTGASEAFSYNDVNYADEDAALSAIRNISKVLSELDGGDYTLTVSAPADVNWKQKSDSVSFSITRASNAWKADNRPHLDGATANEQGTLSYIYDKLAVSPDASALHGKPVYVYYKDGSDTPLTSTPVNAGKYKVEFVVEETPNYEGLSESISFVIAKDTDQSFIVSNGTVGWIYGEYDRLTHVFTGIPRTGGEVSYAVLDSTGKEVITGIVLGDSNGVHHSDFDKDTYVSVADATKVGALLAGDYRLKINVAEMPNYEGFSATSPFKVSPTQNYWSVTPKITPWSIGLYKESENLPVAESRFGSPVIKIVSRNNNEVFYEATFNRTTGSYDIAINHLENAPAGMYTMTAKVDIAPGMYLNPLEETVSLEVYKRGFGEVKNVWYDTPGINPWEANIIQLVNTPYGTPLRGLPYFEFYNSKRDENNQIVIDWENPVKAGEDSFFVAKGTTYFKDFYIPMAPGYYYMVARAESLDGEGNIIAADTLREAPVQFQIYNRENSFKDEPRIETLLFLGDRTAWAQPTAEPKLLDSTLTFKYKNMATGEDLGTVMPTEAGRYIVTAYAKAKYSEMIEKSVEFVVELSTNEWTTHPTIEGWSEEFSATAPDPEAAARYGSENIVYTYENLATGEIKTEKPKEEGSYRLIATVKVAGYKDLVGTTPFTVGPAFDFDLLIVDIVLATVCCGLTVWIIVLAIKKRKSL